MLDDVEQPAPSIPDVRFEHECCAVRVKGPPLERIPVTVVGELKGLVRKEAEAVRENRAQRIGEALFSREHTLALTVEDKAHDLLTLR